MTSKRSLRTKLAYLTRELGLAEDALSRRERRVSEMRGRVEAEYMRHMPKVAAASPSDPPTRMRFGCTGCVYFWPCPTWHTLRRISGDDAEYEVSMYPIATPQPTTGGEK